MRLKHVNMANNKATRALICLCVDSSFSMAGPRMKKVDDEISKFLQSMYNDRMARDSVEIALISFGDDIEVKCNFDSVADAIKASKSINATGKKTEMGYGVNKMLQLLDAHIQELDSVGNKYYKPWLVIISDGEATDDEECRVVSNDVIRRQKNGNLKVKCLNMDDEADIKSLQRFVLPGDQVEQIGTMASIEFFSLLSRSISTVSESYLPQKEF